MSIHSGLPHFKKQRLLTPGPTTIPEVVLSKFAEPIIHHRTAQFETMFQQFQKQLQWLFQTKEMVLTLSATGTGAMEATVASLFSKGDEVITINGGKFGERWTKLARTYGLVTHEIFVDRGKSVEIATLTACLDANPSVKAVLFQASETSTGALSPVEAIAKLCRKYQKLCICDGITAVGIFDVPMDRWGIDVLITGSQKALMLPPGLSFVALSPAAWAQAEKSTLPKLYFDLKREFKAQQKMQTAWTPAISIIQGGVVALELMKTEGLPAIFKRHECLAQWTRAGIRALGLEMLATVPSPVLTTVKVPAQILDGKKIPKIMQERHGVVITGGQDELEGKIFRISHFGHMDVFDVLTGMGALELTLNELGYPVNFGVGTGAVLKAFNENR